MPAPTATVALPLGNIAILGLGLIGGSIGLALTQSGTAQRVVGWDLSPDVTRAALERGAIVEPASSAADAVSSADIVVLAPPLADTIPLLEKILPALPGHALATDVGSLKGRIVDCAERLLPGRFVGGHPMAGSEFQGLGAARAELYRGATWLLTPHDATHPDALVAVERLVRALGAVPRTCDPCAHDRYVGALSHFPHLLAFGLAQTASNLVPEDWRNVAAGSFRDGTRVAASDPELWRVVFQENRDGVLRALAEFDQWTKEVRLAIESGDDSGVKSILRSAHEARKGFET